MRTRKVGVPSMKFSCEKALLQAAISVTSRAVSPKSSIPALEGILLEANRELRLTGYNLETGIWTTVPADIVQGCPPGQCRRGRWSRYRSPDCSR